MRRLFEVTLGSVEDRGTLWSTRRVLFGALLLTVALLAGPQAARAASTISLSVSPQNVTDATPFTVAASGTTDDASGSAAVQMNTEAPGTNSCSDPSVGLAQISPTGTNIIGSPFSIPSAQLGPWTRGQYVLCAWILDSSQQNPVVAASAPFTFTVMPAETMAVTAQRNPTVEGLTDTVTVSGTAYDFASVWVTAKPDVSGAGCGATPGADTGTVQLQDQSTDTYPPGPGNYAVPVPVTLGRGTYLICAWLTGMNAAATDPPIISPVSLVLTVEPTHAQVSIRAPAATGYGNSVKITVSYQADSPRELFVTALPASGRSCKATYRDAPGNSIVLSGDPLAPFDPVGGASNASGTITYESPPLTSSTILCAWIQPDSSAAVADAGPASAIVKVLPPPPVLTYKGRTSQGLPIKLFTQGSLVLGIDYQARYSCPRPVYFSNGGRWNGVSGQIQLNSGNFGNLRIRRGMFFAKLDGNRLNRLHIGGRLRGKRISGSLTGTGRTDALLGSASYPRVTCGTGRVRYSAGRR